MNKCRYHFCYIKYSFVPPREMHCSEMLPMLVLWMLTRENSQTSESLSHWVGFTYLIIIIITTNKCSSYYGLRCVFLYRYKKKMIFDIIIFETLIFETSKIEFVEYILFLDVIKYFFILHFEKLCIGKNFNMHL
jgi:hypothetical protein